MSNLRFIRLNATTAFNGTSLLTTDYTPKNNPQEPLVSVTQATIGRLSFAALLRPGSVGGLVRMRTYDISGLVATVKSLSTTEVAELATPDDPTPLGVDRALQSVTLTTEWSEPIMVGPSDALALVGDRGTVELAFADTSGEQLLAHWNAVTSRPEAPPIAFVTITTDTTLTAWAGDLYVLFEPATPGVTIVLPDAADMTAPARLHLARTGGSWGLLEAGGGGDEINGTPGASVLIGEALATLVELVDGQWIATGPPPTISDLGVTLAVAGTTATLPVIYGTQIVSVDCSAYGNLKLPPIDDVPKDATYYLVRTGDSTASPPIPAQCKLVVDDAGDTMDGVANDPRYLGGLGSVIIVRRAAGGWVTTSNHRDLADQTILVTGTAYTFAAGWVGTKYVRSTAAGATTITGPASVRTPIGCRLVSAGEGAGGVTLSCDANIIAAGTSAATLAAAQLVPKIVEFNGTNWIST